MNAKDILEGFQIPDAIEPVIGWKGWSLLPGLELLISPTVLARWQPNVPKDALCFKRMFKVAFDEGPKVDTHVSPAENCSCGIYIARNPFVASGYGAILGRVAGWGKVIEHRQGWRVQYAYPKEFFTMFPDNLSLEQYGVPVHVLSFSEYNALIAMSDEQEKEKRELMRKIFPEAQ